MTPDKAGPMGVDGFDDETDDNVSSGPYRVYPNSYFDDEPSMFFDTDPLIGPDYGVAGDGDVRSDLLDHAWD